MKIAKTNSEIGASTNLLLPLLSIKKIASRDGNS